MKIKFLLVLFIFINCAKLMCQYKLPALPYQRIVYKNILPIYYQEVVINELISVSYNGRNYIYLNQDQEPILYNEHLYSFYNLGTSEITNYGNLIEKRKADTGELMWQYKWDARHNENHRESIVFAFINKRQQLEVYSLIQHEKIIIADGTQNFNYAIGGAYDMRLARKIFDMNDGKLLYSYFPGADDGAVKLYYRHFSFSSKLHLIKDKLVFCQNLWDRQKMRAFLNIIELDTFGRAVGPIDSLPKDPHPNINTVIDVDGNLIRLDERSNNFLTFYTYDENLSVTDTAGCAEDIGILGVKKLESVSSEGYIVLHRPFQRKAQEHNLLFIDKEGRVKKRSMMNPEGYYSYPTLIDYSRSNNEFTTVSTSTYVANEMRNTGIDILRSDTTDQFKLMKKIKHTDKRLISFFNRIIPFKDRYIIFCIESAFLPNDIYQSDPHALANTIISVAKTDFDLEPTLTNETQIQMIDVYPNPTDDVLNIKSSDIMSSMEVIDNFGHIVYEQFDITIKETQIATNNLAPGMYFLKVLNDKGQILIKKFIKH